MELDFHKKKAELLLMRDEEDRWRALRSSLNFSLRTLRDSLANLCFREYLAQDM